MRSWCGWDNKVSCANLVLVLLHSLTTWRDGIFLLLFPISFLTWKNWSFKDANGKYQNFPKGVKFHLANSGISHNCPIIETNGDKNYPLFEECYMHGFHFYETKLFKVWAERTLNIIQTISFSFFPAVIHSSITVLLDPGDHRTNSGKHCSNARWVEAKWYYPCYHLLSFDSCSTRTCK